jgi:hypothetical protein
MNVTVQFVVLVIVVAVAAERAATIIFCVSYLTML